MKTLKRLSLILIGLALVSVVSGCALKEYRDACLADVECKAKVEKIGDNTETIVSTGVAMVPHPLAPVAAKPAGKAVGVVAELIAALLLGRALVGKKKKEEVNTASTISTK